MFKVKSVECKLGMTVEINGTWTRIDRGMTFENVDLNAILTKGAIKEQFAKAQQLLEEELVSQVTKIQGGK